MHTTIKQRQDAINSRLVCHLTSNISIEFLRTCSSASKNVSCGKFSLLFVVINRWLYYRSRWNGIDASRFPWCIICIFSHFCSVWLLQKLLDCTNWRWFVNKIIWVVFAMTSRYIAAFVGLYFICFLLFTLHGFIFHLVIRGTVQVSLWLKNRRKNWRDKFSFQHNHRKILPAVVWFKLLMLLSSYGFYLEKYSETLNVFCVEFYIVLVLNSLVKKFKSEKDEENEIVWIFNKLDIVKFIDSFIKSTFR